MHFDEKSSQGFFEFTDLELISRHLNRSPIRDLFVADRFLTRD